MNKLIALLLLGSSFVAALEKDRLEGLDRMIGTALETFHIPGIAVGIIIDGKVALTKGYGLRDQTAGLPVTENTLFAIASCTKAFTAHVIGQLVDEGKIDWDDPVIKYIPEFRLKDEYATRHITIRDLITHQSGLPRHDLFWYNSTLSRDELMSRLHHLDFTTDLRGKFQYNNLMYMVAGVVIERITGGTWEEAVRTRIFVPLGMNRSNFSIADSQKSGDFSLPYREKNGSIQVIPFSDLTTIGPAISINSSVSDMVKWVELQLSNGGGLLKKETLEAMHTPQAAFREFSKNAPDCFGYGLGWCTCIHEGHYLIAHPGGIDGFISSTSFLPKEKIGVVVLTNSDSSGMFTDRLANAILDHILGIQKDDWMLKLQESNDKAKTYPLSDYTGEFTHPGYGTIRIHKEEDHLVVSYSTLSISLTYTCDDHFTGAWQWWSDEHFHCFFVRNNIGEVSELHMPMDPNVKAIVFKRVPN